MCMTSETVSLISMIATSISAVSAAGAAIASWRLISGWKKQSAFEARRNSVIEWMSGAALFQGALKQIYSDQVKWPENKEEIEFVSKNFFQLVALWPAVQSTLYGEAKSNAEDLWTNVFSAYNKYMEGSGSLGDLRDAISAIYNSKAMQKVVSEVQHG